MRTYVSIIYVLTASVCHHYIPPAVTTARIRLQDGNRSSLDRIDRDLSHMRRDQPPPRQRDGSNPRRDHFNGLALGKRRFVVTF